MDDTTSEPEPQSAGPEEPEPESAPGHPDLPEEVVRLLRQDDVRERASRKGDEAWTTVYGSWHDELENGAEFACFAPAEGRERALMDTSWDLSIGDGMPGFTQSYSGGEAETFYLRFGNTDGIEPVVLVQSHYGIKEEMLPQVSEEFRLYHNFWQSPDGTALVRVRDDGSEEVVAVISRTK